MNEKRSNRVIKFVEMLKHTKSPWYGLPFELMKWQNELLTKLYGTETENGKRQYRQALLYLPRKSGKTTLSAALALYHLFADGVSGGEVYVVAGSRDQASLCFNTARDMVRQNKQLMSRAKIIDSRKTIVNINTGSFMRALASDVGNLHGLNASCVICDELHTWKDRELWDTITTSGGTRSEPLVIAITTAGNDRQSVCYELYDYAKKVASNVIEDKTFFPAVFEADEDDDWTDPKTWEKANPALGSFRNLDELESLCKKAQEMPALEASFRRLYLNQWVSTDTAWLPIDRWNDCKGQVDLEKLKNRTCYGGLDLSTTTDLSSFCLVFPAEDGTYEVIPYFWIPEAKLLNNRDRVNYRLWQKKGFLEVTPGDVIDYRAILHKIHELSKIYQIKEIAYDRWNASQLVVELQSDGAEMVGTGMGFASMSAPTKQLEELVLSKRIRHGSNPVLSWCIANVILEQDAAGNCKPSKAKSTQRIDGAVALILALSRGMLREKRSVYSDRGLLII
ncbi:MAG: terminase [Alkaliphilus sp.]|nr:terminase large subunit [bacterium AH-315-E09]PHS29518.1 MAG: terminase [Alkaliphilus sp.]